jgi:hypothetical protein
MDGMNAVYAQDEYGRPFIILREQQKKSRLSGIEAQKVPLSLSLPLSLSPHTLSVIVSISFHTPTMEQ